MKKVKKILKKKEEPIKKFTKEEIGEKIKDWADDWNDPILQLKIIEEIKEVVKLCDFKVSEIKNCILQIVRKRKEEEKFKIQIENVEKKKLEKEEKEKNTTTDTLPATPNYKSETIPRTREYIDRISEEAKEILKDPNLFERIAVTEINKKVVGEIPARKVIVLCAYGGRLVMNCQTASFNLMVNDSAGVGKDYTTGASLEVLPKQYYVKKSRISPTVLNYWHNAEDEPQWTWDGKVLYLEDISEAVLNHDVFKVMCSSGSSASIVIDKKVVELEINGKPVMITTTASATPSPELVRRFVILSLDSSVNQTEEIMKRHSKFRKEGIVPIIDEKLKFSMQFLNRVKVKIPFADLIDKHFPAKNIIMRTHYPRFLDYISASAGLYQFQRENDGDFILAKGQDYNIARECFIKLCSNKYMIPLTINQKKILDLFEKEPNLEGTIAELHSKKVNFISDRALAYNLGLLASYGILETFEKINVQNKSVESYRMSGTYKPNEKINIPTYEELCRITSTPSTPSPPSITSIPSLPTEKSDFFKEVAKDEKVAKAVLGGKNDQNKQELQEEPLSAEDKQLLEEFEE